MSPKEIRSDTKEITEEGFSWVKTAKNTFNMFYGSHKKISNMLKYLFGVQNE